MIASFLLELGCHCTQVLSLFELGRHCTQVLSLLLFPSVLERSLQWTQLLVLKGESAALLLNFFLLGLNL